MSKQKGQTAQPKKSAPKARPLSVGELFVLCGESRRLAAELVAVVDREWKRGQHDSALVILEHFVMQKKGKSVAEIKSALKGIDEDRATRILRDVIKRIAAEGLTATQAA